MLEDRLQPIGLELVDTPEMPRAKRRWLVRLAAISCWSFLIFVITIWLTIRLAADRWWLATLLMYGPRWVWGLPLVLLVPLALVARRKWLAAPLLLGLLVVVWPIMGLELSPRAWFASHSAALRLRVLSCNVHGSGVDPVALRAAIAEAQADVVLLQGCPSSQHLAPAFAGNEWHIRKSEELCLASRYPILEARTQPNKVPFFTANGNIARYTLATPMGEVDLINLHLATARNGLEAFLVRSWEGVGLLEENSAARREQSELAARWARESTRPVVIAGDFNMPVDSTIYRDIWSRFDNAFSVAGTGWGPTHFTRRTRRRIDHILVGPQWRVRQCWVGPEVGSVHRPVIAELEWVGGGR